MGNLVGEADGCGVLFPGRYVGSNVGSTVGFCEGLWLGLGVGSASK